MQQFHEKMKDEGYVDKVEEVLSDIREYLLSSINDSLHDAEFESAAEDAEVLAAVTRVEVFVLNETPKF